MTDLPTAPPLPPTPETELVWPGKYDAQGRRRGADPGGVGLPLHTVERIAPGNAANLQGVEGGRSPMRGRPICSSVVKISG